MLLNPPTNPYPFARVLVDYLVRGSTRITWEYSIHFTDALPYVSQLQFSNAAGNPDAEDWTDVGPPLTNVSQIIDTYSSSSDKSQWGKTNTLAYRIKLTTPTGLYYSQPAEPVGMFSKRDFLFAREIIRKETLRQQLYAGVSGWLLKAMRLGTPCPNNDPITGEVTDSNCEICNGTGFVTGYFAPVRGFFVDVGNLEAREHRDLNMVGTQKTEVVTGRMLAMPMVIQGDALVADKSDNRYYIHSVKEVANWRNISLVVEVELRRVPYTDALYQVVIEDDV